MASQGSDVPPSARTPISSPPRRRHRASHSISEATSLPKVHRSQHIHANLKDKDKPKDKDDKNISSPNHNLLPNVTLTAVDSVTSRSESGTPAHSQVASRRTSLLGMNQELDRAISTSKTEVRSARELTEEREKTALRSSELRLALGNLNTLSNQTTRRLDNSYYQVLEKLGVLQSTIVSLNELSQLTRQLNEEFGTEADKLAKEVSTSLDGFHDFTTQNQKIEELAGRVKAGREKVKTFGARVDVVRERVEGWEKAEGEWQDRTRKRLRVLWILMSIAAAVFLGLSVFRYTPARTPGLDFALGLNVSRIVESIPEFETLRNETWSLKRTAVDALLNMSSCNTDDVVLDEDPRLRLFDEL